MSDTFLEHLQEARKLAYQFTRSREVSLIITKLDEARLWYDEFSRIQSLQENSGAKE